MSKEHCQNETAACSGKCHNKGCGSTPQLWVVAACNGMICLFSKQGEQWQPREFGGEAVFRSLEVFCFDIRQAAAQQWFDQLVIIGAPHDMAWLQMSLPAEATRAVVAEMAYPLIPGWFSNLPKLAQVIAQLMT